MRELVDENIRIEKMNVHTDAAIQMFHDAGMYEKEKLFSFRRVSRVNIYKLEEFIDYNYGYMVYSTGYIDKFRLTRYKDGLVIVIPKKENQRLYSAVQATYLTNLTVPARMLRIWEYQM